jgi:hypothetical protein
VDTNAPGSTPTTLKGVNMVAEGDKFDYETAGHAPRKDSAQYAKSRKLLDRIEQQPSAERYFYPLVTATDDKRNGYQDHHGGGLWVYDDEAQPPEWLFVKNIAGMEWASQFCADPKKVDLLRQFAQRIVRRFPKTLPAYVALDPGAGTAEALQAILDEPVADDEGVARWVDSIFNASVPLDQPHHIGYIEKTAAGPQGGAVGGVHHYPAPVTDIQFFKRDDFRLWVTDPEGHVAAVTPNDKHGKGDGKVRVMYATPNSTLHKHLLAAHAADSSLVVDADHPMAKEAFSEQAR